MIVYEWFVNRNGVRVAGPFLRRKEAVDHANRMHTVSISLHRYQDKWQVNAERKEGEITMKDRAIAHITEQMMQLQSKEPIAVPIEEHLTGLCRSDEVAEKLLAENRTLSGAIAEVWTEAKKRRQGNSAYIPEAEVFAIVEEYYGIGIGKKEPPKKAEHSADTINVLDFL